MTYASLKELTLIVKLIKLTSPLLSHPFDKAVLKITYKARPSQLPKQRSKFPVILRLTPGQCLHSRRITTKWVEFSYQFIY